MTDGAIKNSTLGQTIRTLRNNVGLTLREVHTIGESLIKSLNAVYHGRVKYPDQETA